MAEEFDGRAQIAFVNVDDHSILAERFQIRSIPALRLFKGGELIGGQDGAIPREWLITFIQTAL